MDVLNAALLKKDKIEICDKYGFLNKFDTVLHSSIKQFQTEYKQICAKRLEKWNLLVKEYPEHPPRSDKLKRYIRKGIPHTLRPMCWFKYSGAEKLLDDNAGLYTLLTYREEQDRQLGYTAKTSKIFENINVIERDLLRTFPDNIFFKPQLSNLVDSFEFQAPWIESNESINQPISNENQAALEVDLTEVGLDGYEPVSPKLVSKEKELEEQLDLSQQSIYIVSLRRILVAFCYYSLPHPDPSRTIPKMCTYSIGYCQSLNFIVGLLLIVYSQTRTIAGDESVRSSQEFHTLDGKEQADVEEKVFWTLVAVIENLLPPEMYGHNLEGAHIEQEILWKWILHKKGNKFGVDRIAKWVEWMEDPTKVKRKGKNRSVAPIPPLSMITTQWFMTLFIGIFPFETVLRIWDCFIYQGEKVLLRVILTLIKINEDQILSFEDPMSAWKFLKELPKRVYDCHRFMQLVFQSRNALQSVHNPALPVDSEEEDDQELDEMNPQLRSRLESYRKNKIRRGVGSVPSKLIDKYRDMIIQERQNKTK